MSRFSRLISIGVKASVGRASRLDRFSMVSHKMRQPRMQKVASRLTRPFGVDLAETVYALDATTIDLCLAVFPWAPFRRAKAAIKLHTFLDLRGNIPSFIHISDGKMHKVNVLDQLIPEAGAYYVMDRGYLAPVQVQLSPVS